MIFDRGTFMKPVEELQIWIKADKIKDYFTGRSKCLLLQPAILNLINAVCSSGTVSGC